MALDGHTSAVGRFAGDFTLGNPAVKPPAKARGLLARQRDSMALEPQARKPAATGRPAPAFALMRPTS